MPALPALKCPPVQISDDFQLLSFGIVFVETAAFGLEQLHSVRKDRMQQGVAL
jgi:hypothetical protein